MKLSIVIPAHNEEKNIEHCLRELQQVVWDEHAIPHEIIVVNDNSTDGTAQVVQHLADSWDHIHLVDRPAPGGFGRAIRSGLEVVTGEVVVICMADLSDDPQDVVAYYQKISEGYDCVFGSRFIDGSHVENYPPVKLFVNRLVNTCIRWMFGTRFNDLTNAFKAYRTSVLQDCGPFKASHFNITLELSLSALIRDYHIAQIPIRWQGRTWGASNLRLREMGRRYLCTVLMFFCQRFLIRDDVMAEKLASQQKRQAARPTTADRLEQLEQALALVNEELHRPKDAQPAHGSPRPAVDNDQGSPENSPASAFC